jgi:hypothetical protein
MSQTKRSAKASRPTPRGRGQSSSGRAGLDLSDSDHRKEFFRAVRPGVPGLHPGTRERAPVSDFRHRQRPDSSVLMVREGGVEPPRPFGHWNLNPARLPIPPPAHGCCRSTLSRFRERSARPVWDRLPTSRRLARWQGWVHMPIRPRPHTLPVRALPPPRHAPRGPRIVPRPHLSGDSGGCGTL